MMMTNLHESVTVLNANKNFSSDVLKQSIARVEEGKGNI
jgi:hypothetical protein